MFISIDLLKDAESFVEVLSLMHNWYLQIIVRTNVLRFDFSKTVVAISCFQKVFSNDFFVYR
jgi:hypothetical protein